MSQQPWSEARALLQQHVVICIASDPDLRDLVRHYASPLPCRLHTTENADEALAMLDTTRVSLVLADQRLKSTTGSQLLREVARRSPMTARVLLGSHNMTSAIGVGIPSSDDTVHGIIGSWDGPSLQRTIVAILKWQEERSRLSPDADAVAAPTRTTPSPSRGRRGADDGARAIPQPDAAGRRRPEPEREEEGIRPFPRKNSRPT